jgi:glycerophosphoryl diester phosphodiesterase
VESFEQTVLGQLRAREVPGRFVFLAESSGAPADLVAKSGAQALSYAEHLTPTGLAALAEEVDGVSVDKRLLLSSDAAGRVIGDPQLVEHAHAAGLEIFTWTLRAENKFLAKGSRRGPGRQFVDWMGEFSCLIGTGVDGLFADQPDLVLAALAAGS